MDQLIDLKEDGSFRMDMSYFDYCQGMTMTSRKFDRAVWRPAAISRSRTMTQRRNGSWPHRSRQVTEEMMLRIAPACSQDDRHEKTCLAGGVALNCVGNGRILRDGPFEKIWIQPAAGDAGGALGVALFIWHQLLGQSAERRSRRQPAWIVLGPEYSETEIKIYLDSIGAKYCADCNEDDACASARCRR